MIADDIIHDILAEIIVSKELNMDLTTWNETVKESKEWLKTGFIDEDKLMSYIKLYQKKYGNDREVIIL